MLFVAIVSAFIGLSGSLGAVGLAYYLGRRGARRRDLHEAYTSWVAAIRAVVKERAALTAYDHIEAIKKGHPIAAGIAPSPSGRTRAEHVRDLHAAEARLNDRGTNLRLLEPSHEYSEGARYLTACVLASRASSGDDIYGPMFESIGLEKTVAAALGDFEEKLKRDHPTLKRRANRRLHLSVFRRMGP